MIDGARITFTYKEDGSNLLSPIPLPSESGYLRDFEFYLTDHLGNVRVVYKENEAGEAVIVQENDYYPYGMLMKSNSVKCTNNFLYNGKEQQNFTGYYAYGFRQFDSQIARWHSIDKLAESFPNVSPYAYVAGNPVSMVDVLGLLPDHGYDQVVYNPFHNGGAGLLGGSSSGNVDPDAALVDAWLANGGEDGTGMTASQFITKSKYGNYNNGLFVELFSRKAFMSELFKVFGTINGFKIKFLSGKLTFNKEYLDNYNDLDEKQKELFDLLLKAIDDVSYSIYIDITKNKLIYPGKLKNEPSPFNKEDLLFNGGGKTFEQVNRNDITKKVEIFILSEESPEYNNGELRLHIDNYKTVYTQSTLFWHELGHATYIDSPGHAMYFENIYRNLFGLTPRKYDEDHPNPF